MLLQNPAVLRCRIGLFLIVAVVSLGTVGFWWLEGWGWLDSLYMTIITISTVGFKEVSTLSPAAQGFTIALIFLGVGTVAFSASSLFETLLQRQISRLKEKFSMHKELDRLNGHIIVCGYGRTGRLIAAELARSETEMAIIDNDSAQVEELTTSGMLALQGNATEDEVLLKAGLERAEALVAALGNDADNLLLTLTARGLNKDLHIIVRAENPGAHKKFVRAGADHVVSPYVTGANHIVQLIRRPAVLDFINFMAQEEDVELDVRQIEITPDNPLAGKTLGEARVRQSLGRLVLAVKRPGERTIFDPSSTTTIRAGDVLISIGSSDEDRE